MYITVNGGFEPEVKLTKDECRQWQDALDQVLEGAKKISTLIQRKNGQMKNKPKK